jgi:hypothetical protein
MKVSLLTYSYAVDFYFDKNNAGTAEKPKIEYKLRDKIKSKSSYELWNRTRHEIFDMCEKNICQSDVSNYYIYVQDYNAKSKLSKESRAALIQKMKTQMAPWSTEAFTQDKNNVPALRRNVIAVAYNEANEGIGFILANATNMKTYIDVICSKGAGSALIKAFLDWSGRRTVGLSALMNVLQYYPKFGFEFGKCGQFPELTETIKALPKDTLNDNNKLSKEAREIIRTLQKNNLVNPPDDDTVSCKSNMSPSSFVENNCFENGVRMERCLPKTFRISPRILRRSKRTLKSTRRD